MAGFFIEGTELGAGEAFAEQVSEFREKYVTLLGVLARHGTEVSRTRTMEVDLDIAPHEFVRGARHVFVVPPQDVELHDAPGEEVGVIPGTAPYTLTREAKVSSFDPTLAMGTFELAYGDSGNVPELQLNDMSGDPLQEWVTRLPDEVRDVASEVFNPFAHVPEC